MAFKSPNYTQAPNDLFDEMLPDMELSELKVTLIAIRQTFGFHRGSCRLSLTDLEKATGLSRPAVWSGAKAAEKRGTFRREQDGGVTRWVVNVIDQGVVNSVNQSTHKVVNSVNQTGKSSLPPSNKERNKERERKKDKRSSPTLEEFSRHVDATRIR